jgi:hypothetical protein
MVEEDSTIKNGEMSDIDKLQRLILAKETNLSKHMKYFKCLQKYEEPFNVNFLTIFQIVEMCREFSDEKKILIKLGLRNEDNTVNLEVNKFQDFVNSNNQLTKYEKNDILKFRESLTEFNNELSGYQEGELETLKKCLDNETLEIARRLISKYENGFKERIFQIKLLIDKLPPNSITNILYLLHFDNLTVKNALRIDKNVLKTLKQIYGLDDKTAQGQNETIRELLARNTPEQTKDLYKSIIMKGELTQYSENDFEVLKGNLEIPTIKLNELLNIYEDDSSIKKSKQ